MRSFYKLLVIMTLVFMMIGCSKSDSNMQTIAKQEEQIASLKKEIKDLQKKKDELEKSTIEIKEEKGLANYIVTIEIKQHHPFWDFENKVKDELNAVTIELPVTKEYYNNVEVGTVINDEFRVGSLILSGSIGKWDVAIKNKEIR